MTKRNDSKVFGSALRKAREAKDVRLIDLSKRLNVSVPFLSDVENGRRPLSNERVQKAAAYLGVDPIPLLELAAKHSGKVIVDTRTLDSKQLRALMLISFGSGTNETASTPHE